MKAIGHVLVAFFIGSIGVSGDFAYLCPLEKALYPCESSMYSFLSDVQGAEIQVKKPKWQKKNQRRELQILIGMHSH